jgi:hypothetical protein
MPVHLTAEQRQLALRLKARAYRYVRSGPRWAAHISPYVLCGRPFLDENRGWLPADAGSP